MVQTPPPKSSSGKRFRLPLSKNTCHLLDTHEWSLYSYSDIVEMDPRCFSLIPSVSMKTMMLHSLVITGQMCLISCLCGERPLYVLSIRYSSNELRWGKHSISASSSNALSQVVALVCAMPFISQRIKGGWAASGLDPFPQLASCFQYVSLLICSVSVSGISSNTIYPSPNLPGCPEQQ